MKILSPEQIETYNKQGFLYVKNFISKEEVKKIKEEALIAHEKCVAGEFESGITWEHLPDLPEKRIRQLMRSEVYSPTIGKLLEEGKITKACSELLNDNELDFFHSKLMFKSAGVGTFTPWHSDWGYWQNTFTEPTQMNCFLAIDESTLENGCIRYVSGSHKDYKEHTNFKNKGGFAIGLPGDIDAFDGIPVKMEPGDVTFHGSITIHGSEANHSDCSRIMNTFAFSSVNTNIHRMKKEAEVLAG